MNLSDQLAIWCFQIEQEKERKEIKKITDKWRKQQPNGDAKFNYNIFWNTKTKQ